jgi:hypothetical protein
MVEARGDCGGIDDPVTTRQGGRCESGKSPGVDEIPFPPAIAAKGEGGGRNILPITARSEFSESWGKTIGKIVLKMLQSSLGLEIADWGTDMKKPNHAKAYVSGNSLNFIWSISCLCQLGELGEMGLKNRV